MNSNLLFKLACIISLALLANAHIEVEVTNSVPGYGSNSKSRLLQQTDTTCKFFLLNDDMVNNPLVTEFDAIVLNVNGPTYSGSVASLNFIPEGISYMNDLVRIVYEGNNCNCVVTVYQSLNNMGRSRDFTSMGQRGRIVLDSCYATRAQSLSIVCNV